MGNKVLEKLNKFLPKLAQENEKLNDLLSAGKQSEVCIEHLSEDAEKYIEMDLGLGVFDLKMGTSNSNENKEELDIKTRITEEEELIIPISSSKRKTPLIEVVESPLQISQPSPNPGRPKNRVLNQRKKRRSKPV